MKKNLSFLPQPPTPSEKGFPFPRCQIALQTMPFTCYRRFCVKLAWRRHHYSCPRLSSGLMDTRFIQRRSQWHPTPVLLPGKSHRWRSLVGCSPWGHEESDTTEQLHFHFSLLCIGEGNGNPLQCSCLENPRDSGAWWAAVYGVAQSWT